uniref:Uncharacterized protein n=1 Tax=Avena sativa TaxID=4498 RepID=A0ACD5ZXU2_AVESA
MTGEASAETRDWAELPRDALTTIYVKLGLAGTLVGGVHVCRSWRRAAAHEPTLIRGGDDGLLLSLAENLSSLRILRLISCYSMSNEGFVEAIQKFTLLEELEISLCKNILAEAIEAVGKACPHLKHFRLSNDRFYCFEDEHSNNQEAQGISEMHELRSLQLFGNNLNNQGLTSILDNCPHLEFLDIRHCFNVNMDAALQAKCARIETLRLPDDSTAEYEFPVKSPIRYCSNFTHYDECEEHWAIRKFEEYENDYLDDEFYPPEDEDLLEVEEPSPCLEEEIPEDEESMMLDYYAMLDENGLV